MRFHSPAEGSSLHCSPLVLLLLASSVCSVGTGASPKPQTETRNPSTHTSAKTSARLSAPAPEVQVNTYTTSFQSRPVVAVQGDGFILAWDTGKSDGDLSGKSIQARRYQADGSPLADQFQVNTITVGNQDHPSLAAWPDGRFVVTWFDEYRRDVEAQLFDSDGTPNGSEFQVNSYTTGFQQNPKVVRSGENFVVVWQSDGSSGTDDSGPSIQGQRYDASGNTVGAEFQVNEITTGPQAEPAIAVGPDGNFVVVWSDRGAVPGRIQGRRFLSDGTADGGDFQVNSSNGNAPFYFPQLGVQSDSGFVVAWQAGYPDGRRGPGLDSFAVLARRFDSSKAPLGDDFQVNTVTAGYQSVSDIEITPGDGFVVSWFGYANGTTDTDREAVFLSRYDSAGNEIGQEFVVNTYTTSRQTNPTLGVNPQGDVMVSWESLASAGDDNDGSSVQLRRFLAEADLSVTISDGTDSATAGTPVVYSVVVTNNGPDFAPDVSFEDQLAVAIDCSWTSVAAGGATGNTAAGSSILVETLSLPVPASVTYTLVCDVDPIAVGTLSHTATVATTLVDNNLSNNTATDVNALLTGLFVDDFESGDTTHWSRGVP